MTRDQFTPTENAMLEDILCNCECDCKDYLLMSEWQTINRKRLCTKCSINNHMAAFRIRKESHPVEVNNLNMAKEAIETASIKASEDQAKSPKN